MGTWTGELRAESISTVIDKYMDPALDVAPKGHHEANAHYALAKYMDSLYCTYYERVNSAEWHEKLLNRKIPEEVALLEREAKKANK